MNLDGKRIDSTRLICFKIVGFYVIPTSELRSASYRERFSRTLTECVIFSADALSFLQFSGNIFVAR